MRQQLRVAVVITRFIAGAGGVALRGALALDPQRYAITVMSADEGPLLAQARGSGPERGPSPPHESRDPTLEDRWALTRSRSSSLAATSTSFTRTARKPALWGAWRLTVWAFQQWSIPSTDSPSTTFNRHPAAVCTSRRSAAWVVSPKFVAVGAAVAAQASA